MGVRITRLVVLLLGATVLPGPVLADVVVPSSDVTTRVVVRASATSQSAQVGSLTPGEQAELVGSVPNWHEIRLANGVEGFISKRWTLVIATGTPPPPPPPAPSPTFTMHVFDVGTGLAILVRGPDFALIYDGGSNDDLARGPSNRLLAYINAVAPNLTTIDYLILSHPHTDHVELLPDLFATYQVNEVWDSGRINDVCGYRAFITAIHDEPGVKYHNALQDFGTRGYPFAAKKCYGKPLPAATVTLTLSSRITEAPILLGQNAAMSILRANGDDHGSPNRNSLVVRLDLGGTRVLLPGDAEGGERALPSEPPAKTSIEGILLACCVSDLKADVLVAGHHGSMTSSRRAFLDAVAASVFVISSGPMPYGTNGVALPDPVIVSELKLRGQVFSTNVDDMGCAMKGAKIGPDADGEPGGCDAVVVSLGGSPAIQISIFQGSD